MVIVIGSAPWAIGSADRKHTQSASLFRAFLLTSVFMTRAYGPGSPFGELKVTRRTGVLRGGSGRCGLVLGDVRKAACFRERSACLHSGRRASARPGTLSSMYSFVAANRFPQTRPQALNNRCLEGVPRRNRCNCTLPCRISFQYDHFTGGFSCFDRPLD